MYIHEVIVVEGRDDTAKVKLAVQADTIETNGSAINEQIYKQIRHAKEKRGVIVLTDPDYPGERLRRLIDEHVPGCKHAFLQKKKAVSKHGVGVEHASVEDIRMALGQVYEVQDDTTPKINWQPFLLKYGLLGGPQAKERRQRLGERLHIGYANGKQLAKRLNMFQIDVYTFKNTMEAILKEERS
ncbi:ribonuclease M5 [Tenuibacillus multivorans]|uniref:Ribonuclease M5 n=1 Tax=Tenuibacillus multivorans TaxID=237069 RepID=A0A1G9W127_9BACI|nr:ribonuclease M5 [Tenuibacillus multivorans]GEL78269.1 ribonuclease M5 [Tenuibacillus multivorans]SDM78043.1 ribonuclease M5 [Tenuibacillus multivorans]